MLNEPVIESRQGLSGSDDSASTGGVAEAGNGHMSYIQVTPQEKEAIERVRLFSFEMFVCCSKMLAVACLRCALTSAFFFLLLVNACSSL